MSGGKGGSKTQETTIPDWIKQPAIRNMQRAEDVQRIEYMPYYGADVAAFTPTQNAAFQNNIDTAKAFGLLDPNSTLTPTSGMPTPTDYNGFTGYSSQPMYESALAELKAKQPGAVAQYDALFGANVPTTWGGGGGNRFRGSASPSSPTPENRWKDKASHIMDTIDYERTAGEKEAQDAYNKAVASGTNWDKPRGYTADELARYTANAKTHADTQGTIMKWPQTPVSTSVSTAGQQIPWQKQPVYSSRLDTKGSTPTYTPPVKPESTAWSPIYKKKL
jgi:hypothetical protein